MAQNGTPIKKITPRRQRAIAALLSSKNVVEAAENAHVGRRTLCRWMTDPAFRTALIEAEGAAIDAATRRLIGLQDGAVNTLNEILTSSGTSAGLKLRASQSVLDYLLKLRELRSFEQRLLELEKKVNERSFHKGEGR
jgi:hypothetical protein